VVTIRPLVLDDEPSARGLFTYAFGNTLYAEAPRAALVRALSGAAPREAAGLVATSGGEVIGVAVYGEVAGADGAGKMHGMAVSADARRHGVARLLIEALVEDLTRRGARLVLVEFPDAPELAVGRTLLQHSGFAEESRIPDYFRDGIALSFLRRALR
jgi:ribosomal protein S18 acetylase RimI-like enzyme